KRTIMRTYRLERVQETSALYEIEGNGIVGSPYDAVNIFNTVLRMEHMTKEHLVMLSLNTKNKVEAVHIVHVGSLNASITHPRDIYQLAMLDNAASVVIGHNHPSGDPTPSNDDIQVTKRLDEAGKILGIQLLDHVIIGDRNEVTQRLNYTSLKE